MKNYEIERKWLFDLNKIPDNLPCLVENAHEQGYLEAEKLDIRIRKKECLSSIKEPTYKLCFKNKGNLKRIEIEFDLTPERFNRLAELGGLEKNSFIKKKSKTYLVNGYNLTVGVVDEGQPTSFCYGEIEFSDEAEALGFEAPDWFGEDITNEPDYKMASYWLRTRKQNK